MSDTAALLCVEATAEATDAGVFGEVAPGDSAACGVWGCMSPMPAAKPELLGVPGASLRLYGCEELDGLLLDLPAK